MIPVSRASAHHACTFRHTRIHPEEDYHPMTTDTLDRALESVDAAPVIGVEPLTLKEWRRRGYGPPYVKFGNRVRYRLSDLEAWMAEHTVTPGSQAAGEDTALKTMRRPGLTFPGGDRDQHHNQTPERK